MVRVSVLMDSFGISSSNLQSITNKPEALARYTTVQICSSRSTQDRLPPRGVCWVTLKSIIRIRSITIEIGNRLKLDLVSVQIRNASRLYRLTVVSSLLYSGGVSSILTTGSIRRKLIS